MLEDIQMTLTVFRLKIWTILITKLDEMLEGNGSFMLGQNLSTWWFI